MDAEEKVDQDATCQSYLAKHSPEKILSTKSLSERSNLLVIRAVSLEDSPIFLTDLLKLLPHPERLIILGVRTLVGPNVDPKMRNDILQLSKLTGLQEVHLKVVYHFVSPAGDMRSWLSRNYSRMLQETLASLEHLRTLSIECPYLELDWNATTQVNGTSEHFPLLTNLELDTGLHNRIPSLMPLSSLKTLFYSFYGEYLYIVSELDAIEHLLERNRRLEYVCLRLPREMCNRVGTVNFLSQMARDWQAVTFYIASYYDEYYEDDLLYPSLKLLKLSPNVYFDAYPDEVLEFKNFERVDEETRKKVLIRSLVDLPLFLPGAARATPSGWPSSLSSPISMW